MTKEEAISKAQNILSQLSMKAEELKKAEMSKDPVTAKEYWAIQFEGASVDIDPESRNLIGCLNIKKLPIVTQANDRENNYK